MYFKRIILSALLLFSGLLLCQAQGLTKEKIEATKVAMITKKMGLSAKEAQSFWPLYNEFLDKKEVLRQANIKAKKKDLNTLSDKEIETLIEEDFTYKQKDLDLQKEYNRKYKAILPVKKIALLSQAEEEFKIWLVEQMKKQNK